MHDRPKQPRERGGMLEIVLIAGFIAALLYSGVKLLGDTHIAFDARNEAKAERREHYREISHPKPTGKTEWTAADEAEYQRLKHEAAARPRAYEAREGVNTRCIAGTLFQVEGTSYTNIGSC